MRTKPPTTWVVKLGGSLCKGPFLRDWLDALAIHGGGKVVVVPGGGQFADRVRAAQRRWRFDDATGHRMAMLGMAQYGLMLTGLRPDLFPTTDAAGIRDTLTLGRAAVWIPTELDAVDVPRNWSVTSDSLAAWLASRLQANHLALVKSVKLNELKFGAVELARRGVIDEALPALLARADYSCQLFAAQDYASLAAALGGDRDRGTTLTP